MALNLLPGALLLWWPGAEWLGVGITASGNGTGAIQTHRDGRGGL